MPIDQSISLILTLIVSGIGTGMLFAMLGLAITLVFGLGGVLNLSIGMFSVIAVLVSVWLIQQFPHLGVALVAGVAAVAALGYLVDRLALRVVYRTEGDQRFLLGIFGTLGIGIFLEGIMQLQFTSPSRVPINFPPFSIGGIFFRMSTITIILVSIVVFAALFLFFSRTYKGQATRTIMQDEVGARLCGIDVRRLRTEVFVLSAVIAAIAGLLWGLNSGVSPATSFGLATYGILVSIAGGVTSIRETVAAGLVLGFASNFVATFVGSYWSNVVVFGLVIVAIAANPGRIS